MLNHEAAARDSLSFSKTGKLPAIHEYKENIYPHLLRHARARWLLYNGYSMDYVKRFLRHKKISTTIDVYGEYDDEEFMKKSKDGVQPVL